MSHEEKVRWQENANIEAMMKIHQRIDSIVKDKATAEALKPWYMLMCKRPCFHNDYLPTFNWPNVHPVDTHGQRHHRNHRERVRCSRAGSTSSTCSSTPPASKCRRPASTTKSRVTKVSS